MGRPNSFEKNNAIKEVQCKWKLLYLSAVSGIYTEELDSLIQENAKTDKLLSKRYGDDWHSSLMKEVEERLIQHDAIRLLIKTKYAFLLSEIKNVQIEIDDRNKRKAILSVFGVEFIDEQNRYFTYYKFKIKTKKMSLKKMSWDKELIDFSYPQNDILNK